MPGCGYRFNSLLKNGDCRTSCVRKGQERREEPPGAPCGSVFCRPERPLPREWKRSTCRSGASLRQLEHSYQAAGGRRASKHPGHQLPASVPGLARQTDPLHPATDFFPLFALLLTDHVTAAPGVADRQLQRSKPLLGSHGRPAPHVHSRVKRRDISARAVLTRGSSLRQGCSCGTRCSGET